MITWLEILFCFELSRLMTGYSEVGNYQQEDLYKTHNKKYSTIEVDIQAYNLLYTNFKIKSCINNINSTSYISELGLTVKDSIKLGFRNTYIDYNTPVIYDISHPTNKPEYNELFFRTNLKNRIDKFPWLETDILLEISKIISGTTQLGINQRKDGLYKKEQYFSTITIKFILYNHAYVDFGFKTKMTDTNNYSFYPYQVSNKFEVGGIINNIKFGLRHICIHPEDPWSYTSNHDRFNASNDEIFISYEYKFK